MGPPAGADGGALEATSVRTEQVLSVNGLDFPGLGSNLKAAGDFRDQLQARLDQFLKQSLKQSVGSLQKQQDGSEPSVDTDSLSVTADLGGDGLSDEMMAKLMVDDSDNDDAKRLLPPLTINGLVPPPSVADVMVMTPPTPEPTVDPGAKTSVDDNANGAVQDNDHALCLERSKTAKSIHEVVLSLHVAANVGTDIAAMAVTNHVSSVGSDGENGGAPFSPQTSLSVTSDTIPTTLPQVTTQPLTGPKAQPHSETPAFSLFPARKGEVPHPSETSTSNAAGVTTVANLLNDGGHIDQKALTPQVPALSESEPTAVNHFSVSQANTASMPLPDKGEGLSASLLDDLAPLPQPLPPSGLPPATQSTPLQLSAAKSVTPDNSAENLTPPSTQPQTTAASANVLSPEIINSITSDTVLPAALADQPTLPEKVLTATDKPVFGDDTDRFAQKPGAKNSTGAAFKSLGATPASTPGQELFIHRNAIAENVSTHDAFNDFSKAQSDFVVPAATEGALPALESLAVHQGSDGINMASSLPASAERTVNTDAANTILPSPNVEKTSDAIVHATQTGQREITLQLNPESLGQLRVQLSSNHQQDVQARFITTNPEAQQEINNQIHHLKNALARHGIHLDAVQVVVSGDGAQNNTNHDQSSSQENLQQQRQDNEMQQFNQSRQQSQAEQLFKHFDQGQRQSPWINRNTYPTNNAGALSLTTDTDSVTRHEGVNNPNGRISVWG